MSGLPSHPPVTQVPRELRAGRWFVCAGYTLLLGAIAAAIVESFLAWGETSSATLVGCAVVIWLASAAIAYGRKLRGELPPGAFRVGRGIASLPIGLIFAYYGPTLEQFGAWWALLLPHSTYDLLEHTIGLPYLLALPLTILVAPFEIFLSLLVPQLLIVSPLSAVFGSDSPLVDSARDLFGGIQISEGDGLPEPGIEESTVWGGESSLR